MPSPTYYAAIDQGTTSSRFIVFDQTLRKVVAVHQMEHTQITPHPGWLSHDAEEIFNNVITCMNQVVEKLGGGAKAKAAIKSIGITNQRETTVAWSRKTGAPLCHAIVWSDARTQSTLEKYPEFKQKSEHKSNVNFVVVKSSHNKSPSELHASTSSLHTLSSPHLTWGKSS